MKLKKTILGLAVVAVAGVNAWLANDVNARNSVLSMLNLENIAEANECIPGTIESRQEKDGSKTVVCCVKDDACWCAAHVYTDGGTVSGAGQIAGRAEKVN